MYQLIKYSWSYTIKHCPVIQKLELRLSETNTQNNGPSSSVIEHPPPSTTIMRTPKNFFERGLISESIQRQVAAVEQAMNHGMEELADNVSQVTDPIDTNFDASTPSSPMPTGLKSGLMKSY